MSKTIRILSQRYTNYPSKIILPSPSVKKNYLLSLPSIKNLSSEMSKTIRILCKSYTNYPSKIILTLCQAVCYKLSLSFIKSNQTICQKLSLPLPKTSKLFHMQYFLFQPSILKKYGGISYCSVPDSQPRF